MGSNPSCAAYHTAWVSSDNKSTSPFMRSVTIFHKLLNSLRLKTVALLVVELCIHIAYIFIVTSLVFKEPKKM